MNHSLVEDFISYLNLNDSKYDLLKKKILSLDEESKREVGGILKKSIIDEKSHFVRNNMALVIRDIGDESYLDSLFSSIEPSHVDNYRGTVLYAISKFNAINYIERLTKYAVYETMESRSYALDAIENFRGTVSDEILQGCIKIAKDEYINLEACDDLSENDRERLKDIKYLLEIYEDLI